MKKAALWYASKARLPVFPLHAPTAEGCSCGDPDCDSPGKHPRTRNGFKDATTNPRQIEELWTRWPDANIGIPTGATSGLFAVDIDPRNGGPADRAEIISSFGALPDTAEAVTGGGGRHICFCYDGEPLPRTLAPGIDIKGENGYIVVAPSLHPSGRRYQWDGMKGAKALLQLASPPKWLLESINNIRKAQQFGSTHNDTGKWPAGERNNRLTSIAGALRHRGLCRESIEKALIEENSRRCDPPLPESEVRTIAGSVARYQPGQSHPKNGFGQLKNLSPIDAETLMSEDFKAPEQIVTDLLCPGVTLLTGRPKSGKSWLALELAIAVATGRRFLGRFEVRRPGRVLYSALEDAPWRIKQRLHSLIDVADGLNDLKFIDQLEPLSSGGIEQLDEFLAMYPAELLIIDTLLASSRGTRRSRDIVQADYDAIALLRELSIKRSVTVLLVHHTRKGGDHETDEVDSVIGTTGTTAAADAIWTLQRTSQAVVLATVGRDIERERYELKFDLAAGGWSVSAMGGEVGQSSARCEILALLEVEGHAMGATAIATALRKNRVTTQRLLTKMYMDDVIKKTLKGAYYLPSNSAEQHSAD